MRDLTWQYRCPPAVDCGWGCDLTWQYRCPPAVDCGWGCGRPGRHPPSPCPHVPSASPESSHLQPWNHKISFNLLFEISLFPTLMVMAYISRRTYRTHQIPVYNPYIRRHLILPAKHVHQSQLLTTIFPPILIYFLKSYVKPLTYFLMMMAFSCPISYWYFSRASFQC